ncbi:MAG TPA: DUF4199 domain-containing protein [Bacteroidales bacterium]|nr:DUF4199 domain-containing protein [Bacteroidales bacterium]
MEDSSDHIKRKYKYAADYALVLGGYIAFFFIIEYLLPNNFIVSFLSMVGFLATPVVCYQLAKRYRDRAMGGYIRYWQVWSFGVWLFFFAALIMSVLYYLRYQFLQPDFIANAMNQSIQLLEQMKYPQKYIDGMINYGVPTTIQLVLTYLWMYIIGGAILFLIISPMVARKKEDLPPTDQSYKPYQDNKDQDNKDSDQEPKA